MGLIRVWLLGMAATLFNAVCVFPFVYLGWNLGVVPAFDAGPSPVGYFTAFCMSMFGAVAVTRLHEISDVHSRKDVPGVVSER